MVSDDSRQEVRLASTRRGVVNTLQNVIRPLIVQLQISHFQGPSRLQICTWERALSSSSGIACAVERSLRSLVDRGISE